MKIKCEMAGKKIVLELVKGSSPYPVQLNNKDGEMIRKYRNMDLLKKDILSGWLNSNNIEPSLKKDYGCKVLDVVNHS